MLEVGPGVGCWTKELARGAQKESGGGGGQASAAAAGGNLAEYENVTVVEGDVLKVDLAALIRDEFPGLRVAGNVQTCPIILPALSS